MASTSIKWASWPKAKKKKKKTTRKLPSSSKYLRIPLAPVYLVFSWTLSRVFAEGFGLSVFGYMCYYSPWPSTSFLSSPAIVNSHSFFVYWEPTSTRNWDWHWDSGTRAAQSLGSTSINKKDVLQQPPALREVWAEQRTAVLTVWQQREEPPKLYEGTKAGETMTFPSNFRAFPQIREELSFFLQKFIIFYF